MAGGQRYGILRDVDLGEDRPAVIERLVRAIA